jgi:hypothetical protein
MQRLCSAVGGAVLLAAISACSQSPQKAAADARQAAGSWGATVSAAAERWNAGEVSATFFESVVTQATEALRTEEQSARSAGGDTAAAPVQAVATHVAAIAKAVARGDREAAVSSAHDAAAAVPAEKTPPVAHPQ